MTEDELQLQFRSIKIWIRLTAKILNIYLRTKFADLSR